MMERMVYLFMTIAVAWIIWKLMTIGPDPDSRDPGERQRRELEREIDIYRYL